MVVDAVENKDISTFINGCAGMGELNNILWCMSTQKRSLYLSIFKLESLLLLGKGIVFKRKHLSERCYDKYIFCRLNAVN